MHSNFEQETSLESLMALAQQGDLNAYARVFEIITPLLRKFVRHKINKTEDSEDVVQEILISIHQASHTYDTTRPFHVWMYTIARYRLNDYLRSLYGRRKKGIEIGLNHDTADLASEENVTYTHENREYLIKMLRTLPKKQRTIVTKLKIEGFSIQETALAMKMSESAVKVSAHRAYKMLTQKAEEYRGKQTNEN
jgi:RNA polymerase sigma-70 factor (ECF subfamily)